jgi:hypothetical protein
VVANAGPRPVLPTLKEEHKICCIFPDHFCVVPLAVSTYYNGWHLYVSCETGLKLAPKGVPKFNGGIHFNTGHRNILLYWVLDLTYPKLDQSLSGADTLISYVSLIWNRFDYASLMFTGPNDQISSNTF